MIPKLVTGKDGNWTAKIGGKRINFKTPDYFEARKRAQRAVENGEHNFTAEQREAAEKVIKGEQVANEGGSDWTADAVRAAGASSVDAGAHEKTEPPPEDRADYFPPGERPSQPEPGIPHDTPATPPEENTQIPPEMMRGLIRQIAETCVELQLHGQEYLFLRWGKIDPGVVPPEHDARRIPRELWEKQLHLWLPTDIPLPPWAVAIILTALMGGTVQFEGAKPLPRKPEAVPNT